MNWLQLQSQLRVNWQSAQWLHIKSSQMPQNYRRSRSRPEIIFLFRPGKVQLPILISAQRKNEYFPRLTRSLSSWPTAPVEQLLFYTFLIRFLPANEWLAKVCLLKVCLDRVTNLDWNSLNTCQKYPSSQRNWILCWRCHPSWAHVHFCTPEYISADYKFEWLAYMHLTLYSDLIVAYESLNNLKMCSCLPEPGPCFHSLAEGIYLQFLCSERHSVGIEEGTSAII